MWIALYDVAIRRSKCEYCYNELEILFIFPEKLLQAVRALKRAKSLDPEHPELHIRLVHCRLFGKLIPEHSCDIGPNLQLAGTLPQPPPPPIGPLFNEELTQLIPGTLSLETYNSQYLQRHSTAVPAILAAAKVLRTLQSPLGDIEATVFTALGSEAKLDVKVLDDLYV